MFRTCPALIGIVFSLAACSDPGGEPVGTSVRSVREVGRRAPKDLVVNSDPAGTIGSFSSNAFQTGSTDGFFAPLGTNGRTCGTCHHVENGWTIAAATAQAEAAADPADPLFAPVDGSDCPPTSPSQKPNAARSNLLVGRALIRIQIGVPDGAGFDLVAATNPGGCALAPGSAGVGGQLFLFRRPLPATNIEFLTTVMWDGRETVQAITTGRNFSFTGPLFADLAHQDNDATLGHEQATKPIVGTQAAADALAFETNLYSAQVTVGSTALDGHGGHGGPTYIGQVLAPGFHVGVNDPLGPGFDSEIFHIYRAWEPRGQGNVPAGLDEVQRAIGRGERLFNTRVFTIADVPGLNSSSTDVLHNPKDPFPDTPIQGTCGICHNTPDVGNHSTSLPINIGVTLADPKDNDGHSIAGILAIDGLPVYTLSSPAGTVQVTDPARALISGRWVDVGKTKGPILRGLAGRAPYFHNGSAPDLATVVEFYDARFEIGLTAAEKSDLVAFLQAL